MTMLSSWLNTTLSLTTIIATTAVTASLVTLGLQYLVKDHNAKKTIGRFHHRRKATVAALKETESAFNALLAAVSELRAAWNQTKSGAANGQLHTPPPSDGEDATDLTKRRKHSVTECRNPMRALSDPKAAHKRLAELEEQAMRLLEKLDSINPSELSADLNIDLSSSPSSSAVLVTTHTSRFALPPFISLGFVLFDTSSAVRLDPTTEALVRTAVDSCRERKRIAVGKILELIKFVDLVVAEVASRGGDNAKQHAGKVRLVDVAL